MTNVFNYLLSMMALTAVILTMVQKGETNLTISDKIATDTEFYFREFHVYASKMATIEYSINLNKTNIGIHCVEYNKCEVSLDIYTTEDDQNLKKKLFDQYIRTSLQ